MIALLDKIGATTAARGSITSGTGSESSASLTYEDVGLTWSALHGQAAALMQVTPTYMRFIVSCSRTLQLQVAAQLLNALSKHVHLLHCTVL
jgi:hypothetical protein